MTNSFSILQFLFVSIKMFFAGIKIPPAKSIMEKKSLFGGFYPLKKERLRQKKWQKVSPLPMYNPLTFT
jgi:hypothetical protein